MIKLNLFLTRRADLSFQEFSDYWMNVHWPLVKTVPEGIYLTTVKENGKKIEIHGVAQSSTRVSTFMRNIDSSAWMDNPTLEVVETAQNTPTGGSSFTLFADTKGVNLDDTDAAPKKVAAK